MSAGAQAGLAALLLVLALLWSTWSGICGFTEFAVPAGIVLAAKPRRKPIETRPLPEVQGDRRGLPRRRLAQMPGLPRREGRAQMSPKRGHQSAQKKDPQTGRRREDPPRQSPCPKCAGKKGRWVQQNSGPDRWDYCGFCAGTGVV